MLGLEPGARKRPLARIVDGRGAKHVRVAPDRHGQVAGQDGAGPDPQQPGELAPARPPLPPALAAVARRARLVAVDHGADHHVAN